MATRQVLAALVTHLWFKTYEPKSPAVYAPALLAVPFLVLLSGPAHDRGILVEYLTFYTSLLFSVVVYRLSPAHPLAQHPGPLLCKITKFKGAWEAVKGDTHRYYLRLHQQYGPIVRVGPNELCIVDKDAIAPVLGSMGMPKGPIWDGRRFGLLPQNDHDSLIDSRDQEIHDRLRKPWNQAFSAGPLKDYHPILVSCGEELASQLHRIATESRNGEVATVNIVQWINFFAFDFMGQLAFGGSFSLMKDGDIHGHWQRMSEGLSLPAVTGQIPWMMPILQLFPYITAKRDEFRAFGTEEATKRIRMETKQKDLFHHLYEVPAAHSGIHIEDQMDLVVSNSLLTMVAGSDATSTTLSCTICCLLAREDVVLRLRRELDEAFTDINEATSQPEIEIEKLLRLPYLGGVVNEGLRLAPAVPSNIQRAPEKGSGGRPLGGTNIFIPEGTSVNIPAYSFHHDPRYFSPSPESFIPERWLPDPENKFTTNREAFIPFSYGPANCAGKPMALLELRFVIAILVQRFDMCYKGYRNASLDALLAREAQWIGGLKDKFVFSKGPLEIEIVPRRRGINQCSPAV